MEIIDATPPADIPDQVIMVQEREFALRNPDAAFLLRVKLDGGNVDMVQLPGAICRANAVQIANKLGYAPTHYIEPGPYVVRLL